MSNMKTQKNYINGLKGFACIMVMLGHFIGIYKYAENFPAESGFLRIFDTFIDSKLSFILDETFWVILFFFVSGYLVSFSKIPDIKSFIYKSFMRFLRLGLPILFACLVIWVIQKTFGFYTVQTISVFENSFIQKNYLNEISLWQVVKSPIDVLITGDVSLCGPYWVLREMFITSVLIYLIKFLKEKIDIRLFVVVLGATFFASMVLSNIVFSGLFGMIINLIQNDKDKHFVTNKLFLIFALVFSVSLFFIPRSRIASVFFGALILTVPEIKILDVVFSSKISQFINRISFGIYSFHWPVFASVGMFVVVKTHAEFGLMLSAVFSIVVSTAVTIVISILYYYIFEKQIYRCLKSVDGLWHKK